MAIDDVLYGGSGPLNLGSFMGGSKSSGGGGFNFSTKAFDYFGGAVSDLFAAKGHEYKAAGDEFEKQNYQLAAGLADQNAQYTEWSTAIKQMQEDREIYKSLGQTRADVAGAGFAESGSALDILRESAQQGALVKSVIAEQGLISEAGYHEQAQSYKNMASAAQVAIDAENEAAKGAKTSAIIKGVAGVASIFLPMMGAR